MADPATDEALRRFRLIRLFLEIDMPPPKVINTARITDAELQEVVDER